MSSPPPPGARRCAIVWLILAGTAPSVIAHASPPPGGAGGFGPARDDITLAPELDCSPFEARTSPAGFFCEAEPEDRGAVVSTRAERWCTPTEVALGFFYTTTRGVERSIPRALVYHCKDGVVHGSFEKTWVSYSASTDTTSPLKEKGEYTSGQRSGTWTFQSLSEGGQPVVRTASYQSGHEVGTSRTTEGGKLTKVGCSSRAPEQASGFFVIDLAGASAERVALAEKALSACGEWSTATCEGFRLKGLFDDSVSCECDAQCPQPGTCKLTGGRCLPPASAEECGASRACRASGLCGHREGKCQAETALQCEGSAGCSEHGLCGLEDGQCVATETGCARSADCKAKALCTDEGERCGPGNPFKPRGCGAEPCPGSLAPLAPAPRAAEPAPLGERRSPALFGLGATLTGIGAAGAVAGIATWTILGKRATDDEIAISGVLLGGGLGVTIGGLVMMAVFGQRKPVPAPAKNAVVVRPILGLEGFGVHGQF